MSDDKIINLVKIIQERKMENTKKELDMSIEDLDMDIDKILSAFVFFNLDEYNKIYKEVNERQVIINNLIFTIASLDALGLHEAAEDIQSVINKLNNYSYGDDDESKT
jgi:hypothetical protein